MEHILLIDNENTQFKSDRRYELYLLYFDKDAKLLDKVNAPLIFGSTQEEVLLLGLQRMKVIIQQCNEIELALKQKYKEVSKKNKRKPKLKSNVE